MAKRDESMWAQVGRYSSLAFVVPVSSLVGLVLGWLLDKLFHTHFLYLVFLALGIAAGFLELIREVREELGP